jgi:two-component system cell cycle sensor histidine kinase/response regulator CckA
LPRLRPWRVAEASALGGVTLLLAGLVFFRNWPFEYGLMPQLAWAAFRFGMRGTSAAAAVIAVLAAVGTSLGSSPFARGTVNDSLLALDSFLAVTVVFSMLLAGVLVERTSAYEALEDSKERFAAMFNCSTNFIALTDAVTGAILDLNDKLVRASGMSRKEAVGRTAVELGLWPSLETRGELVTALKRQGRLRGHEVTLQTAAGPRDCAVNAEFVDVRGHRLVLWEIRDLTETRRAQQEKERLTAQLLQSQKMEAVGQLAGGVAHDFNNLLTVIINNCDLTLEDPRLGSEPRQNVEMVRDAGESAANLTRQLLAFSRKQVLQPSRIDLNALVTRLERMLRRVIGEDVALVTRLGAGLWPILADPGQIEQVIVNLAVNSRDAMPDGGSLTLETGNVVLDEDYGRRYPEASSGDHAMLAVSDTGVGMDAATLSRIFEPFFSTKGHRGTGLGLSTVHGIVRQSGGHLVPHSEPGQGTTFRIYLPRHAGSDQVVERRAEPAAARLRGETVLVVEDSPNVRKLVASLLVRRGHRVLQAGSAAEALQVAAGHPGPIDLLITDVVMPGMSGRQMAAELVAARPDLAVLYMSGYAEDTIVKEGVLQPGIEFIAKPFTNDSFARKVDEVLGRRARPAGAA